MATRKANSSPFSDFLKNRWTQIIASVISVLTIFGFGYSVGEGREKLDSRMEKLELQQQCNERVQTEINNCRESKLNEYGKSVDNLKDAVETLKTKVK